MSEEKKSYTAVLLPGARVAVFARDNSTKEAFQSLENDWRFARVTIDIHEGDLDTAIQTYATTQSPDLVVVQTETIDDTFSDRLEALAGNCSEGTAAIVVGPDNDVNLYRKLVSMGVSDYLVKPLKPEILGHDIAATLIEQIGAKGSRLIALMGAKGGVGTTVLAEALAWGASDSLGQKTFLLDASGGWSTLSVGMNFEPTTTLAEATRSAVEQNEDSLTRMVHAASEKLFILSSGGDVMLDDTVQPESYETLLGNLMAKHPVVIVDLSGASAGLKRVVLTRAHEILLITIPTLSSVRASRTLIQEIKELRGGSEKEVDLIINMQGMEPKNEVSKAQIEEGLGRKAAVVLPHEPGLFLRTESQGKKLSSDKAGLPLSNKLLPLIRKILVGTGSEAVSGSAGQEKKKSGLGGLFHRLKATS